MSLLPCAEPDMVTFAEMQSDLCCGFGPVGWWKITRCCGFGELGDAALMAEEAAIVRKA
jgi:hypothetical protein